MTRDTTSREFERLVALIETHAAPREAIVKAPDRIRDLRTGRLREVDASIRLRVGTADILLTIECRKRGRPDDVTWIEQLATKRESIGAAKTIAVSASGFSKSARNTASLHGIELRVLSEVGASEVEGWMTEAGAVHLFRLIEDVKCEVVLADRELEVSAEDSVLSHSLIASPFPAVVLLQFLELTQPNRFWSIPLDGTKTRLTFELDASAPDLIPLPLSPLPHPERSPLQIDIQGGRETVRSVRLSALVSYEAAVFSEGDGRHYEYGSGVHADVQHTVFEGAIFGLPARFDHQRSGQGKASVRAQIGEEEPKGD